MEAKPRLENGRKTSCAKRVSKNIRVHAFGDCCTVVDFRVLAVPGIIWLELLCVSCESYEQYVLP